MELETFRKSWEQLNTRLMQTEAFNQKLVENIITTRVVTTVDKIKRLHNSYFIVLSLELICFVALFIGNPFDFKYRIQFVPFVILLIGVVIAFANLVQVTRTVNRLSPGARIDQYLSSVIRIYDRNKRFERWFGIIFLSMGLIIPFSFLPPKIERLGLTGALGDTAIMIGVNVVLYVIAFKLGLFNNPHKTRLEKDLAEWNELKALSEKMKQ
jgi:dolichol kinase